MDPSFAFLTLFSGAIVEIHIHYLLLRIMNFPLVLFLE